MRYHNARNTTSHRSKNITFQLSFADKSLNLDGGHVSASRCYGGDTPVLDDSFCCFALRSFLQHTWAIIISLHNFLEYK